MSKQAKESFDELERATYITVIGKTLYLECLEEIARLITETAREETGIEFIYV